MPRAAFRKGLGGATVPCTTVDPADASDRGATGGTDGEAGHRAGPSPAARIAGAGLRLVVVAAAFFLGALFAIGSLVATLFEVQGFGSRSGEARPWYLASLALGLLASVGAPFVVWRLLLPGLGARTWVLAAAAVAVAFMLFGLTLAA